jgi:hypothetical protein
LLSKILLGMLLALLASKYGLFTRLKRLKPRVDRAVNVTIALLVILYIGQFFWLFTHRSGTP